MDETSDHLSIRSILLIAAFGLTAFTVRSGPPWVLTYHEAYFAEPAREMLRTGDWLIPRMGGIPSWQKPPLTHWMIALAMGLTRSESEWVVRFPTLLCTIANALFVAALAARWHGDRVGRLTGLIGLTTFYALFQGRLAEADMPLCAAVSGAMLALAIGTIGRDRSTWSTRLAFFAAAGLSTLIKGPIGLALIGGAAGLFAIIERRWAVWRFLLDPAGWAIMIALSLAWPIAAYRADPSLLTALRVHNVDRFTGAYEGGNGTFFYAYVIPGLLLPWTPMAFGGLIAGWRDRARPTALWRLMACWMIVGLALISASAWKHKHYPIPLLPPMSIAAAYGLDRYVREARREGRAPFALLGLLMVIGGSIAAAMSFAKGSTVNAGVAVLIAASGAGLGIVFRFRRSGQVDRALVALFATVWLVVVLNESLIMPRFDLYRPHAEMARRLNATRREGEALDLVEVPNPQILFYLRPPFRRFDRVDDFIAAESPAGTHFIVGSVDAINRLERMGVSNEIDRSRGRAAMAVARVIPQADAVQSANASGTDTRIAK